MTQLRAKSLALLGAVTTMFAAISCEEQKVYPTTASKTTLTAAGSTTLPVTTNIVYKETMEGLTPFATAHDLDVGTWTYALQFVSAPAFRGTKSARFEIREDQPLVANGKRSEVTIIKGSSGQITNNAWYSFAVYFPSAGYEYDDEREVINQWFQSGSPATSLRTRRDRILLETGNTPEMRKQFDLGAITKNRWHTFVFHFIHSYHTDGLIEVWQNGTKKLTYKGGNMYDDVLPKWKIGLYKSAFKYGTSAVSRRIIYFDNIIVGNEKSTYNTMNPAL